MNRKFNSGGGGRVDEFERAVVEAVDEAFLSLGDSVRRSLYWYLENHHGVARDETPFKLDAFVKGLRSIFGEGANILVKMIAKRLYGKLGLPFEEKAGWGLIDYVEHARKNRK